MSATESELRDPALVGEVDLARAAAQEEAADEEVGAHVGTHIEADTAVTHLFEAAKPGYRGWRWAVTVASAGPATDVTVSEVVLLPGPDALVAPDWIPWENRVKAGDLGVGDLLPTAPDDPRLVPAYVESDDPAIEEAALEVGLGRPRVMARPARLEAAARWQHSEFGPRSDMARSAPAHCGTCGFYLPLAGSLRAAFGTCGNEIAPADGHVVHAEYGCGAHSEAEVEQVSPVLVANLIYDDAQLDLAPLEEPAEAEASAGEAAPAEATLAEAAPAEAATTEADAAAEAALEAATGEPATDEAPAAEEATAAEEVAAGAPARKLSDPGQAAEASEPQLPFPDQEPPAAEPVAPLEALVTAETSIDAPTESGAPATLTPWIRPEGAARTGDVATEPNADEAPTRPDAAEARSEAEPAEAPSESAPTRAAATAEAEPQSTTKTRATAKGGTRTGGLLRGGLLKGGLLTGGLLRNRRAPIQANATDQPAEIADRAESPGAEDTDAASQTEAALDGDAAGPPEAATEPEGPTAAEDEAMADAANRLDAAGADGSPETERQPSGLAETEATPETGRRPESESAAEAASHTEAPAETEDPAEADGATDVEAAAEAASHTDAPAGTEGSLEAEGVTESLNTPETEAVPAPEGPTEAAPATEAPAGAAPATAPEPTTATEAAQEHHPWEPSFRPYWMRSADERRTEGD